MMVSLRRYVWTLHFVLVLMIKNGFGANVLMAGIQFPSHILCQVDVAEELVSRGHNVYFAIADRYPKLKSIEKKGITLLTYQIPFDEIYGVSPEFDALYNKMVIENPGMTYIKEGEIVPAMINRQCNHMMNDYRFLEKIRSLKFDIAVVEPFHFESCNVILPKYFDIPFILLSATLIPWNVRIPALPSLYTLISPWRTNDMTQFKNRLSNLFEYTTAYYYHIVEDDTAILERFTNYTAWRELMLEAQLFIHQLDHIMDDGMPTMPNIIRVPSVSVKPSQPLPTNIENLMSSAHNGVIYMSFGATAMYGLDPSAIQKLFRAFSQINHTILLRVSVPQGIKIPVNVHVARWFPQNDLLGHSNIKLFITHCGNGGQDEAIYHAVPMLGFPLFGEQARNCQKMVSRGFGLELNFNDFTVDQLVASIREILDNPKYAKTIGKYSQIMRSNPMTGRETAAYWIEHVIKFGGEHLRSAAMDMPLYQFLMIDIIATIVVAMLLLCAAIYLIINFNLRQLRKFCFTNPTLQKAKQH